MAAILNFRTGSGGFRMGDREFDDKKKDAELGMNREITRRDFLNGVAIGTGAALLESTLSALAPYLGESPR